jgi:hypothetical protein
VDGEDFGPPFDFVENKRKIDTSDVLGKDHSENVKSIGVTFNKADGWRECVSLRDVSK